MQLESLANELLLELFEYLDGIHIFRAFYGLNRRFNKLLLSYHQIFRFNFRQISKEDFDVICKKFLTSIAHRVISIEIGDTLETPNLPDLFLSYGFSVNQFFYLKYLKLYSINDTIAFIFPHYLSNLEYLSMVNCYFGTDLENHIHFFDNIWKLPKLNYLHFDCSMPIEIRLLKFSRSSLSLKSLWIRNCHINCLLYLFEFTPNLRRLSTRFQRYDEYFSVKKSIVSSLTCLKIDFNGNMNRLLNIFQCLPNLVDLTIETSVIDWNGYEWRDVIEKYFPKLKKFQFKIESYLLRPDTNIDYLLDTFRTEFWLEQHQWFVGCQYNPYDTTNSVILYTLPYTFKYLFHHNDWYFKSTCPNENNSYLFDHVQTVSYSSNNMYSNQNVSIYFPNIQNLSIRFVSDHHFISYFPSLQQLKSLEVSIPKNDDCIQLQILLNRAPCLYTLNYSNDNGLSKKFFQLTSSSIRELNLLSSGQNYFFNSQDCIDLISSSLGRQCEILSIDLANRIDILNLIQKMSNLRSLRFTCKGINWYSSENKRDFLVWLENHLSSTFSFREYRYDSRYIDIWINRQMKDIRLSSEIENKYFSFPIELKQFFKNLFHL